MSFSRRFGLQFSPPEGLNLEKSNTMTSFPARFIQQVMGSFNGTLAVSVTDKKNIDRQPEHPYQYQSYPTQHRACSSAQTSNRHAPPPPPLQYRRSQQYQHPVHLGRKILSYIPDASDNDTEVGDDYTSSEGGESHYQTSTSTGGISEVSSYTSYVIASSRSSSLVSCHSGSGSHSTQDGYGCGTSLPPPPRKNVKRPVITSEPDPAPEAPSLCSTHACEQPCFACEPPRWEF